MRNLHVFTFTVALWLALIPGANCQNSKLQLEVRRDDAARLTKRAHKLSRQADALAKTTKAGLLAESTGNNDSAKNEKNDKRFDLEVRSSIDHSNTDHPRRVVAPESKTVLRNYAETMARYRAALGAYLQHRKEVQQHAAAFHKAAQNSNSTNSPPPSITVPAFKPLAVQTQDACDALQQAEAELHNSEMYLFQVVQMMMNNRKNMSATQYASLWGASQEKAISFKQNAGQFDQGVVAKQENTQSLMHGKMEEAMRDGDYVESQKVYGEQQRSSMLLHQEVKRATTHSALAMQFLNQLQTLSPYVSAPSQSANSDENPAQFALDDQRLAQEFEQVQLLYKQVEEASPKFH
jgi:hypothetical protein